MRRWWRNLRNKVYFVPVSYSVMGFFIALAFMYVDIRHTESMRFLPDFIFTSPELADSIFSALVGALLTMITVSFSTIMVVLTLYSGQFTPRITRDFLEGRVPLQVLGLFMASFFYSIVSLYSLDKTGAEQMLLSPFMGVVLAISCLGFFGYFIHHVARSVQINYIIDRIAKGISRAVESDIAEIEASDNLLRYLEERPEDLSDDPVTEIPVGEPGFIKQIDYNALVELACQHDLMFDLRTRVGEYLEEDDTAVSVYAYSEGDPEAESLAEDVQVAFSSGAERDTAGDVEFGIIKLVEVALRAISPGINDPNTAIYCISKLGPILRKIGRELESMYYYDEESTVRLHVQNIRFRDLLYSTYYQLRTYGQHDVSVLAAMLDSLEEIADGDRRVAPRVLWDVAEYMLAGVESNEIPQMDRRYLKRKIRDLARSLSVDPSELLLKDPQPQSG